MLLKSYIGNGVFAMLLFKFSAFEVYFDIFTKFSCNFNLLSGKGEAEFACLMLYNFLEENLFLLGAGVHYSVVPD
jgi:hypothetical protein